MRHYADENMQPMQKECIQSLGYEPETHFASLKLKEDIEE